MRCLRVGLLFLLTLSFSAISAERVSEGQFVGNLSISPAWGSDNGAVWVLNEDFGFIEGQYLWLARKGDKTDGASIPTFFWRILGHPFNTKYIQAAVVHDHFCQKEHLTRTWEDTHRMFYRALVASKKVDSITAKAMFYAVYLFGPRWELASPKPCKPGRACIQVPLVESYEPSWGADAEVKDAYDSVVADLRKKDISIQVLEERASKERVKRLERREQDEQSNPLGDYPRIDISN